MASTDEASRDLRKGSAEMLILALIETRPRHGYEIAKCIESQSDGKLQFHVASLYPALYRLERKGWVSGKWVEKPGERRRRFYRLTPLGRKNLERQRVAWSEFMDALNRVARFQNA